MNLSIKPLHKQVKDDVLEFANLVRGGCSVEASKKANLTLNAEASETQPLVARKCLS
jgi:hypothetical protein